MLTPNPLDDKNVATKRGIDFTLFVFRMELDKTRWCCPWNSDQNCTQNSARGWWGQGGRGGRVGGGGVKGVGGGVDQGVESGRVGVVGSRGWWGSRVYGW